MPFANEVVSEEDIKRHGLDELMKQYNEWNWRNGRPSIFTHSWTIDRERGVFVLPVKTWHEVGPSGRSEPTSRTTWLIDTGGRRVAAVLDQVPGTWSSFSDSPFHIAWNLIDVDTTHAPEVSRSQVVQLLKEALAVYGYGGVRRQVPNTVVTFKF